MLRTDFMPRSHNAALEQRKSRFDGIRVNIAMRVLSGVIDRAVLFLLESIERPRVNRGFVRHNHFNVPTDVRLDNLTHRIRAGVLSMNQPQIAVTLPDADYHFLL